MESIRQILLEENVPRELSESEIEKIAGDQCISNFHRAKLEREAKKNWDLFYKRNRDHFFKDRHWTTREFVELITEKQIDSNTMADQSINNKVLLEVGCGVGNFVFPLIKSGYNFFFLACDFSPIAVDLLKTNPLYDESKCKAFVADITNESVFLGEIEKMNFLGKIDLISLVFVLSAISPDNMDSAVDNIFKVFFQ